MIDAIITPQKFDAVLFDMDGVLTATAKVHAASWKKMFDGFLKKRAAETGQPCKPFDIKTDYKLYVDGKLRDEGVSSFLESRSIKLPFGEAGGPPEQETVSGLGNRKNELVNKIIETEGVDIYEGSIALVRLLRQEGIKTAVVSASKNCETVLNVTGITDLFDVMVDGNVAARLGLPGKPAPDTFLQAAKMLDTEPQRAVVVEDAISGVQAGRAGNFGLVIGVDRHGEPDSLKNNGADIVVDDLDKFLP
ncbi:MAG: beta-phosphoglucomutase family hydrolase [Deltaproteobacteria bacterium]